MDVLHDPLKILQSVSIGKGQTLDTSAIKLTEIYLPPGHFPVGLKSSASLGIISIQQETYGKDLRIDHFFQRIKSHIIFLMSYLKIRPGNMIHRSQKFQSQLFCLFIIGNRKPPGNLCRVCFLELFCIMFPGHPFLAVFFII